MFNKRKNKTFSYKSRFTDNQLKDTKTKLDTKREMTSDWSRTRKTGAGKRKTSLPLLLILLGIIIAVFYYLESKM